MQDDITPERLENTVFSTSFRGYDKDEVDAVLQATAETLRALEDASQKAYLNLGEKMGGLLQNAKDEGEALLQKAEAEVAALRTRTNEELAAARAEAEAYAASTRREAESFAASTRTAATEEAQATRTAAENGARARIAEAERRVAALNAIENETRERLTALHAELDAITQRLSDLDVSTASPSMQQSLEVSTGPVEPAPAVAPPVEGGATLPAREEEIAGITHDAADPAGAALVSDGSSSSEDVAADTSDDVPATDRTPPDRGDLEREGRAL